MSEDDGIAVKVGYLAQVVPPQPTVVLRRPPRPGALGLTRVSLGAGLVVGWKRGPRLIEFYAWDANTGERLLAAAVTEKRRAKLEAAFRALAGAIGERREERAQ